MRPVTPARKTQWWITLAWAVVLVLAFPAMPNPVGGVLEALVYLVVLLVLARAPGLRELLQASSLRARWTVALVSTIWLFVQLAQPGGRFFPLASWSMYGDRRGRSVPTSHTLTGTTCQGARVRLDPSGLIPTLGQGQIRLRLEHLYEDLEAAPGTRDSLRTAQRLTGLLTAIARLYEQKHGPPLCRMSVGKLAVSADSVGKLPFPSPEPFWDVDVR